jgi:hypothetical protein
MELHRRIFGAFSPLLLAGVFVVGFVISTGVSRGADSPSDTTVQVIFSSGLSNLRGWKPDHARARIVRGGDATALVTATRTFGVFALTLRPGPPAQTVAGDDYTASTKVKARRAKRLICLYLREQLDGETVGRAAGCRTVGRRWTTLSTSPYPALKDGDRFVLDIFTVARGGTSARRSFLVTSAKITRRCKSRQAAAGCSGSSGGTTIGTSTSGGGTSTDPGGTSGTTSAATTTETVTQPPPATTAPLSTTEGGAIDAPATAGVWVGGTYLTEDIDADGGITTWEANHMGMKHMKIRQRYGALLNADGSLKAPLNVANQCSTGQIPEVTIYPAPGGSASDAGVLQRIIDGQYDAHIASLARSYGGQACDVLVRLMPEMNGDWNREWYTGGVLNGAQYQQAFQHVVAIFDEEGTQDDVSFVFAPSMGSGHWENFYPNTTADWIGGDSYNPGSCKGKRWTYFGKGADSLLHWDGSSPGDGKGWYDWAITKGKPLIISETGSAETAYATDSDPPSKAAYVTQMLADFKAHPAIKAWVHEEYTSDGNCNWQADSSPTVQQAFLNVWTDPYLIGR